jgi:hypothetical protein
VIRRVEHKKGGYSTAYSEDMTEALLENAERERRENHTRRSISSAAANRAKHKPITLAGGRK